MSFAHGIMAAAPSVYHQLQPMLHRLHPQTSGSPAYAASEEADAARAAAAAGRPIPGSTSAAWDGRGDNIQELIDRLLHPDRRLPPPPPLARTYQA